MTRTTPSAAALLLLAIAGSCFQLQPLTDCAQQDGLYLAYHVCMPLARSLPVTGEPRELVIGDFDGGGVRDDIAVLHDVDRVVLHMGLDRDASTIRELSFTGGSSTVASLFAADFLDDTPGGDDLFAAITRSPPTASDLIALPNGGDLFAGPARTTALKGFPFDNQGLPTELMARPCYAPKGGLELRNPLEPGANLLLITCVPDGAFTGPLSGEFTAEALPDAIVMPAGVGFEDGQFGAFIGASYRSVDAAQLTMLDVETMTGGLVFAHRPLNSSDSEIAIVNTAALDPDTAVAIKPRQGSIDAIRVDDLDQDGDVDLLAIHLDRAGFSIIRQQPGTDAFVTFGEPEFYTLEVKLSDLALGDFTGDGGRDIAVAHTIDNTSLDGVTIYALDLEQPGGPVPYVAARVGSVKGTIVSLKTLDINADGRDDLAVAVRDGSMGYVNLYVNDAAEAR